MHGSTAANHEEIKDNFDLKSDDLDPECDFIVQKDLITKVTEVNEEGESSTDNQEGETDENDDADPPDFTQKQFNQRRTSWNKSRQLRRNMEQIKESFSKIESSRNTKNLRYKSNENSAIFSAKGK